MARTPRTPAITQMPRCDLGSIQGLAAHVEMNQSARHCILEAVQYAPAEILGKVVSAEPMALQHEEGQLLGRIQPP